MDTHELAMQLLQKPPRVVICSVDLSHDDDNAAHRCFGNALSEVQYDNNGVTATLLFTDSEINYQQEQERTIKDLSMLVTRLCAGNNSEKANQAKDYLHRKGLSGSPLRKELTGK